MITTKLHTSSDMFTPRSRHHNQLMASVVIHYIETLIFHFEWLADIQ